MILRTLLADAGLDWIWQVILMDHVDWLDQRDIDTLCEALSRQVIVRT